MKNLIIASRHHEIYSSLFNNTPALISHYDLIKAGRDIPKQSLSSANVLLGEPDLLSAIIDECPNLEWVQSTWAGNNKLLNKSKTNYQLTGVKDVFGMQMVEYVLAYLLFFGRRIQEFQDLKEQKQWSQLPCQTLASKTIGIMGLGSIGQDLAAHLSRFGARVIGLNRKYNPALAVEQYQYKNLATFLSKCEYVISVLPETKETTALCNSSFFSMMQKGSVFMNVGRGSLIDTPSSLIEHLQSGQLSAVVLDVFDTEPLPQNHPYYSAPNLYISCHTAAISEPDKVFEVFADNAIKLISGAQLNYLHDFKTGY